MTTETSIKRILFVDDDPDILRGLKRMLRPQRKVWIMEFADSGTSALSMMESAGFDLVVSDMRMPDMNGVQLLNEIKDLYPGTIRFILSGHADPEMIYESIGPAHQFLAKPCPPDLLISTITKALHLRGILNNKLILDILKDSSKLPTIPDLYQKIVSRLNSPDSRSSDIAEIISQDVVMTAKIMQLVNSAFFGIPRRIESIENAITMLGVDTISGIVLTACVFEEFDTECMEEFLIKDLYSHSVETGAFASEMVRLKTQDPELATQARIAGMIHDLGKLIFIQSGNLAWRKAFKKHREYNIPLHQVEMEMLGITHAEVGAYLLGLWGLPDGLVEAVAFHHNPSVGNRISFDILAAVHLADIFQNNRSARGVPATPDEEYLQAIGVLDTLPELEALCPKEENKVW
jgi:HD-like signal output (HDOD) protein/CheY-like chemotaxis protein